jgi:outer membrane immunogenic protein
MKRLLVAAILAVSPAYAFAADMAVKARPLSVAEPAYDWSGFYIGGQLGGMWSKADSLFIDPPPATFSNSGSSGIGGGFVGAQIQWNKIVLGVEANVLGLFDRDLGRSSCNPLAACGLGSTYGNRLDDVVWSVGPRFGWAAGKWMPFLTGGYAATRLSYAGYLASGLPLTVSTQDRSGWYAGVGVDWAVLPNVVVGLEYRHYDFGTLRDVPTTLTGVPAPFNTEDVNLKSDTVVVRASYKFGGTGSVVAKY